MNDLEMYREQLAMCDDKLIDAQQSEMESSDNVI